MIFLYDWKLFWNSSIYTLLILLFSSFIINYFFAPFGSFTFLFIISHLLIRPFSKDNIHFDFKKYCNIFTFSLYIILASIIISYHFKFLSFEKTIIALILYFSIYLTIIILTSQYKFKSSIKSVDFGFYRNKKDSPIYDKAIIGLISEEQRKKIDNKPEFLSGQMWDSVYIRGLVENDLNR